MNPFMMSNMFFGPMGMSIMPMCGCSGISMPYYGMNDRLTFMNFPIFRNTGNDYLLDPRLALMQCQQQCQTGSLYGNTMLPLFSNFPGMAGTGISPWVQPRTESEEEKKKRETREAEAKKPEAAKAASLKKIFDDIKKLAEANTGFVNLEKSIIDKAEEAMKKETASEQFSAMKDVIAQIPNDILKKAIYADKDIKKQLRAAGFNFNKYSLPNSDIAGGDADNIDKLTNLHDELQRKSYNELQIISSQLADKNSAKDIILNVISTWNDKYHGANDKGLLRWIGSNLPEGKDEIAKKEAVYNCTLNFIAALEAKATDYKGCKKIDNALQKLLKAKEAMIAKFDKNSIYKVAEAYDALYARLRMQDAVKVRSNISSNNNFKVLGEVKPDLINEKLVVDETYEDLKSEGFSNPPKESELDEVKSAPTVSIGAEGVVSADKNYEGKPQELLDEYLAGTAGVLTKVGETNVYKTKDYDGKGNGVKYYTVKDNKLVECDKDGKAKTGAEVKAADVEKYNESVTRLKSLLDDKSIEPCEEFASAKYPYPVFKATGKDAKQYFALIGDTFGQIKDCTELSENKTTKKIHATGTNKTLDKLTESDLNPEFRNEDIKSVANLKRQVEEKEQEEVQKVTELTFESLKDAKSNKKLKEVSKAITGKDEELDFKALPVQGYFYSISTKKFYRYNETTNQFDYLKDVVEVNKDGYLKYRNGTYKECHEVISENPVPDEELVSAIQNYGQAFAKDVNGKSSAEEDSDAFRKLNTIISKNDPLYTVNFIKGYRAYGGFWSNKGICRQIATEDGFAEGDSAKVFNSKRRYISEIAKLIIKVVDITNFDTESEDYETLKKIAKGEYITKRYRGGDICLSGFGGSTKTTITSTAEKLDEIIEKVMKAYDEVNK